MVFRRLIGVVKLAVTRVDRAGLVRWHRGMNVKHIFMLFAQLGVTSYVTLILPVLLQPVLSPNQCNPALPRWLRYLGWKQGAKTMTSAQDPLARTFRKNMKAARGRVTRLVNDVVMAVFMEPWLLLMPFSFFSSKRLVPCRTSVIATPPKRRMGLTK